MAFKVLIVDDDADLRVLMARFLSREGYDIRTAENGDVAIHSIQEDRPDLVVCDIRMPVCDGIELDRKLSGLPLPPVPILFMSGYLGPEDVELRKSRNYVGFIEKPIPRNEVIRLVKAIENSTKAVSSKNDTTAHGRSNPATEPVPSRSHSRRETTLPPR